MIRKLNENKIPIALFTLMGLMILNLITFNNLKVALVILLTISSITGYLIYKNVV